jgi:nitrogen fixation NifU-like protein
MDRETAIAYLVDHYKNPRFKGYLEGGDVSMPGGNPGCGDLVTVHLKAEPASDRIAAATFEGSGCTISQAAASILLQKVNREQLSFGEVMDLTYEEIIDLLGRDVVGFRHRCATLALGTLKAAVKTIEMDRKLRAAGHSEEDIRRLREAAAERAAGAGLVVGAEAGAASADTSLRGQTDSRKQT